MTRFREFSLGKRVVIKRLREAGLSYAMLHKKLHALNLQPSRYINQGYQAIMAWQSINIRGLCRRIRCQFTSSRQFPKIPSLESHFNVSLSGTAFLHSMQLF